MVLALYCCSAAAAGMQAADAVITLVEATMRVDPASSPVIGELAVKGEKLPAAKTCKPEIQDWTGETTPGLSVFFTVLPGAVHSRETSFWLGRAEVKGLPPNTMLERHLRFACGEDAAILKYTVTNRRKSVLTLAATGPGKPLNLLKGRELAIPLKVSGDGALTNLSIGNSTLVDENTGVRLGAGFLRLEGGPALLASDTPGTAKLSVSEDFTASGQFKGNVSLLAPQLAEAASFELTVNSTSYWAWATGIAWLAVGIAASWYVTIYARARVARA
jgi:hypothetical protein